MESVDEISTQPSTHTRGCHYPDLRWLRLSAVLCPSCVGVFLTGNAADHNQCILSPDADQDHDSIDDICEFKVAQAFAPRLVFHPDENQRSRETYWAVKGNPLNNAYDLDIAYLLGYHDDRDHDGDSEYIQLMVHFDTTLTSGGTPGRWILVDARYSAHYGYNYYMNSALQWYNGQTLDRPLAFVARGKHANYNSVSNCEEGGLFGSDYCQSGFSEDVDVFPDRNVGSWLYHGAPFKNYVFSTTGDSDKLRPETLWARSGEFCGWQDACQRDYNGQHVANYGERLEYFGWVNE